MKSIKKVLIANRGEIACRIIRTLRKMRIMSVAVYSDADRGAKHVQMADQACYIGPSIATSSYLMINRVLEIAKMTGADAIHPGYGFLAENAEFAKQVEELGIIFIGPPYQAISLLGDKVSSKKCAKEAGVSLINGYIGFIDNIEHAKKVVQDIGLPVMLKASGGGGGRGMQVVRSLDNLEEMLILVKSEAINSFGSDTIFIEKYIENPKHIEIQVLADKFGNVVCLGERECSIQRRHQKIIEEAYEIDDTDYERIQKMYSQARSLVKDAGYYSVGTIEFLLDQDRNFYFLEMNTRIQVEHTVTELVTDLDLIEHMIYVAEDRCLSITQDDVRLSGYAIEVRVNAENPDKNFAPSTGVITEYIEPEGVRIDSGVKKGFEVGMYYDSMIAKICVHSTISRHDAISKMMNAIDNFYIDGLSLNLPFIRGVLGHKDFISGVATTNFLQLYKPKTDSVLDVVLALFALHVLLQCEHHGAVVIYEYVAEVSGEFYQISLGSMIDNCVVSVIDKEEYKVCFLGDIHSIYNILCFSINGRKISLKHYLYDKVNRYFFERGSDTGIVRYMSKKEFALWDVVKDNVRLGKDFLFLKSPLYGMVIEIFVKPGDRISSGTTVCIIEALKMHNYVTATEDNIVAQVHVVSGDTVKEGDIILEYEHKP
ncbi:MAG: propionyl-CoA carboxylase alpha chain [Candidatus Xenolissoclinum pacificiensis L6]|uniref:Propionyl-CoA carboxylase alpha chain n=1 Tax=Candidatus Xenolissoclinum pacificiensis L6 TaxID=1401685 RepID=W2UZ27_9RICK|nr:MAG: propionyl-CoA carboxylase alpha chain [Candidatus Xenolissoclinum pacificiensis L6]